MSERAKTISNRVKAFSNEVIAYVEGLSDADWSKICASEQWAVGATARHIGSHFGIFELAAQIVRGEPLPDWTMDDINAMSNKDSEAHADCSKADALNFIRDNSLKMHTFISGLSEDALDSKGRMPAFSGEVSVEQLITFVIFQSAAQHFDSIKAVVGR